MSAAKIPAFIQRIPKAELHCHLEGSIQPSTLLKLAAHHQIELPFKDEEGAKKYSFENFDQFIDIASRVSNIALKIFPNMADHPIKRLMDAGVFVTVNSDDPSLFHGNVVDNYIQVADTFNLTADDIEKLARNSFMAAFMDDAAKADYLERFSGEVSQLRVNTL